MILVGSMGLVASKLSKIKDKKPLRLWFILGIIVALLFVFFFAGSFK